MSSNPSALTPRAGRMTPALFTCVESVLLAMGHREGSCSAGTREKAHTSQPYTYQYVQREARILELLHKGSDRVEGAKVELHEEQLRRRQRRLAPYPFHGRTCLRRRSVFAVRLGAGGGESGEGATLASFRHANTTVAPMAARPRAVSYPMPVLLPVTMHTRPCMDTDPSCLRPRTKWAHVS